MVYAYGPCFKSICSSQETPQARSQQIRTSSHKMSFSKWCHLQQPATAAGAPHLGGDEDRMSDVIPPLLAAMPGHAKINQRTEYNLFSYSFDDFEQIQCPKKTNTCLTPTHSILQNTEAYPPPHHSCHCHFPCNT